MKLLDDESISWMKDILSFSDKLLGEVIVMLICYCNGVLCCDFVVVGLCLSGMFLLKNIDVILNVIV